ncbi:restriction endonuclease subunit S, partial [bacterium]|nr:restriction endonuclease subunit S [bacterium]
ELPFFMPKDVSNSCYVVETEKNITLKGLENCNSQKYSRNTVFVTARGTVGKVCMAGSDMAMNQSCYAIRFKNDNTKQYYVYGLIKHLADQLTQHSHGTVFETITTDTFRKIQAVKPSQSILAMFCARVEPLYDLILSNTQVSRKLLQIRDSLLPRLMSGRIRINVKNK